MRAPGGIESGLVAAFVLLLRNICTSETIVKDCKSSPR